MIHPGLPLAKICILVVVVITMFTAATNNVAVDSITTISSSTRSAVPHTLGPPTPTRTFATTLNSSGADEIMIDDDIMLTVATNTVIPTVPRALHDPSAVRGANNLDSTTSHEGHHHVHDRGGADEIMIGDDTMLTVATNTAIPTLPRAPHDPSAVRGANDLDSTTSHEGHHRVHDRGADVHDFGFFDVIMPGADYNNDYLLETCHSSAPPPRASVPRIERDSAPPPRDRPIVAAITDDATAIRHPLPTATVAAIAVVKSRNNNAHRASPPPSTGPILSGPERSLRVTARGPPIPARHANNSTDAIRMPTASVQRSWQVQQQVPQRTLPILLPIPAPRKTNTETNAARKQRRKTQKCLAADVAGASAADASAPTILAEPSLHPSLLETTAKYRPRTHQSAGALKRKADRAARFADANSIPDASPDDPVPTKSPSPASYDFPLPEPLINPQSRASRRPRIPIAGTCATLSSCASSATDSDAPSGPRADAIPRPAARSCTPALRLGSRPPSSATSTGQRAEQ